MRQKKCRPSYLRGDSRTAGQLRSAGGDPRLRSDFTTNVILLQIGESRPWDILGPMLRQQALVKLPENERFLLDLANEAKARGDFAGYEQARRAFLLAQAKRY